MKTIFKNKVTLLFFALIMVFGMGTALGQGLYSKKTEVKTETKDNAIDPMLRASGNEGGDGDPDKIEGAPLSDGFPFLLLAGLGYGFFIWKREQKQKKYL
jgi:hypothetical protein